MNTPVMTASTTHTSADVRGPAVAESAVITVSGLHKHFTSPTGDVLPFLPDIDLTLLAPSAGTVRRRGAPVDGTDPGTALLFQPFALMPWLTVQQNVELGLQARGVPAVERRSRALAAIGMSVRGGFEALIENAYECLTGERAELPAALGGHDPLRAAAPLPHAEVEQLTGLLEELDGRGGAVELPVLADALSYAVDDLMPLVETAKMLAYARVRAGELRLTTIGSGFASADILTRKHLFAAAVLANVPLIATIRTLLTASDGGRLRESHVTDRLRATCSESTARQQLTIAITWGRYAELFEYDARDGVLTLLREDTKEDER